MSGKTLTMALAVTCCVLRLSAAEPQALPPVHDPVMAQGEDGKFYIYSTGMGIGCMSRRIKDSIADYGDTKGIKQYCP